MTIKYPSLTVTGLITAGCETLFNIVSDPTRHPDLAGSGEVMQVRWTTHPPVGVGSGFVSLQCKGWYQYLSRSFVQVYDPPYWFVWRSGVGFRKTPFGQVWGFHLAPVDARSTLVSHLMKWPVLPMPQLPLFDVLMQRRVEHELSNMRPTLGKLAKLAGAQIIGNLQVTYDWLDDVSAKKPPIPAMTQPTPAR